MIVLIEDGVFSSSDAQQTQLIHVLHLGFEGRHRIQVEPLYEPDGGRAVNRWLAEQAPPLREEVDLALEAGLDEAVTGIPSDHTVKIVAAGSPDWSSNPPRLPLATAEPLLRQPLELVLENRRHDWAFLLAVALEPWRDQLREALQRRHIERAHGGGLTEMRAIVEEEADSPGQTLHRWYLFDSDALEPGRPSVQSEALRSACELHGYGHHQLRRRASENYLPPQAIQAWAYSVTRSARRQRERKTRAFVDMEARQRHHYNMKRGFRGDEAQGIPELFGSLPEKPELQDGFGSEIAKLYLEEDFTLRDDWFIRDGQREETQQIIQAIFRAL